jgi:hypothetical protein
VITLAVLGAVGALWFELVRLRWQRGEGKLPQSKNARAVLAKDIIVVVGLSAVAAAVSGTVATNNWQAILVGFGVPNGPRGILRMAEIAKRTLVLEAQSSQSESDEHTNEETTMLDLDREALRSESPWQGAVRNWLD